MRNLQAQLDPLAWHFADLICELAQQRTQALFLGALVASLATEAQHACAYLPDFARQPVLEAAPESPSDQLLGAKRELPVFYPAAEAWQQALRKHSDVVGLPGEYKPLILDGDRLYLYRYWDYEERLALAIRERLEPFSEADDLLLDTDTAAMHDLDALRDLMPVLFKHQPQDDDINWQAVAAASALKHRFHVISGGPGTGKTTTVSRMVALLLHQTPDLRIVLAAPTGKAATRMKESLSNSREQLQGLDPALLARFPTEALTLHRLLGFQAQQGTYRHHKQNPLPWDLVIVDEASMIDLAMMTRLLEALAENTRLVLLGDQYQLASVEAGSVLGDICQAANTDAFSDSQRQHLRHLQVLDALSEKHLQASHNAIDSHVVILKQSYRFPADKGIGRLAACVQSGQTEALANCLKAEEIRQQTDWSESDLKALLLQHYAPYFAAPDAHAAWKGLNQMMILCALKGGPRGVLRLNQLVEQLLSSAQMIQPGTKAQQFYHLRPVMITQNDYRNQLFNGDMGVTWQPDASQKAQVYFQQADGEFRAFHPAQLGPHSTSWAITIHKSQGSEFKHVLLVLPDQPHKLVSRELIYTGITRARESVNIWCSLENLQAGVDHQIQRYSGLMDKLK